MSITITDKAMTCTHSSHWAWREAGNWVVTWLQRPVDHTTAVTALNLAELHGGSLDEQMSPKQRQSLAETLAAELDMSSKAAATRIHASAQQAQNLRAHDTNSVSETW